MRGSITSISPWPGAAKTTFYYEPISTCTTTAGCGRRCSAASIRSAQAPDDARAAVLTRRAASAGLAGDPLERLRDVRGPAIALALSREWRTPDLEARLGHAIDAQFEPTWDHDRGESPGASAWVRSIHGAQYNAFLATAEAASPGAWTRLSAAPLEACPQVVGVDFPNVALAARYGSTACSTSGSTSIDPIPPCSRAFGFWMPNPVEPGRWWEATAPRSSAMATLWSLRRPCDRGISESSPSLTGSYDDHPSVSSTTTQCLQSPVVPRMTSAPTTARSTMTTFVVR